MPPGFLGGGWGRGDGPGRTRGPLVGGMDRGGWQAEGVATRTIRARQGPDYVCTMFVVFICAVPALLRRGLRLDLLGLEIERGGGAGMGWLL